MTKIEQDFQNENIDSQTLIQDFFSTYPEYIEQKEIITQAWNFLLEKSYLSNRYLGMLSSILLPYFKRALFIYVVKFF